MASTSFTVEPGGWLRDDDEGVRVRFRPAEDGRLEPVAVEMLNGVISNRSLADVPFGSLEAASNNAAVSVTLLTSIETDPDEFQPVPVHLYKPSEVKALLDRIEGVLAENPTRYPAEFFEDVAVLYAFHAAGSDKPAKGIAERFNVPVSTVWRWVRVCRERKLLPAARPGKKG